MTPTTRPDPDTRLQILLVLLLVTSSPPLAAQGVESTPDEPSTAGPQKPPLPSKQPVWLGVQVGDDSDAAGGALVGRVVPESPAARGGIEKGDTIQTIDGRSISGLSAIRQVLAGQSPGSTVSLTLERNDKEQEVEIVLSAKPKRRELLNQQLVGRPLPSFRLAQLTDQGEEELDSEALAGKPMVIEFWATWCPPCRQTAATMRSLHEQYGDRVGIVPISRQSSRKLRGYRQEHQLPYSIYRDLEQTAHRAFYISSYPTLIVVGPDGRVEAVFLGAGHRSELEELVEQMVDNSGDSEPPP